MNIKSVCIRYITRKLERALKLLHEDLICLADTRYITRKLERALKLYEPTVVILDSIALYNP